MPHKTSKPTKPKETNTERARRYLTRGGIAREDSDDELGFEDHPWEWIFQGGFSSKDGDSEEESATIIGAKMGNFECRMGDTVLLKADGTNEAWIGIICEFQEDDEGVKEANFMWFSTEKEIRNRQKKRTDAVKVCDCL